jgi:hypothetical protein
MNSVLNQLDPGWTALLLAAAMLGTWSVGFRIGRKRRMDGSAKPEGKFEDAVVAILGLLLAFTFSMALSKYDQRREMLVHDSNAIGDFYTCASLLPEPFRTKLQGVVRDYTQLRLDVAREKPDAAGLDAALGRFQVMQNRMTELAGEAVNAGTPIAVPLTNTLNELTSSHASRLAAVRDRLPGSVVVLLFFSAAIATGLVGRAQGTSKDPPLGGTMSFLLLVTLVAYVILDLNNPVKGFIAVSQEPMERVLAAMGK